MSGRPGPVTLDAWIASWNTWALCTEPADVEAATRGIAALYALHGARVPRIRLVESPQKAAILARIEGDRWRHEHPRAGGAPDLGQTGVLDSRSGWPRDPSETAPPNLSRRWLRETLDGLEALGAGTWQAFGVHRQVATVVREAFRGWMDPSYSSRGAPTGFRILNRPHWGERRSVIDEKDVDRAASAVFGRRWDDAVAWLGRGPTGRILASNMLWRWGNEEVHGEFRGAQREPTPAYAGQFDAIHPYLMASNAVFGKRMSGAIRQVLDARLEIARSCGPWWQTDSQILISDRPLYVKLDDQQRPHAEDGPALLYRDGWAIYARDGVTIESRLVSPSEMKALRRR